MKPIFTDNWIELIFIDRNKEYGAFQLRKKADENQLIGIIISNLLFVTLLIVYQILIPKVDLNSDKKSFIFKSSSQKLAENQLKNSFLKPKELKIVAIESNIDLKLLNFNIIKEEQKLSIKLPKPFKTDFSDGIFKYSIDPKTGERFLPEKIATYSGGMDSFIVSIRKQIKFKNPTPKEEYLLGGTKEWHYENGDEEIDGEINTLVFIECVITTTGKLDSVKLFKGASDPKFNERVITAFKNSRDWKPAYHNGKAVSQRLIIPFHFDYKQPLIKFYN